MQKGIPKNGKRGPTKLEFIQGIDHDIRIGQA
jgi:hypothetical protein